ncbi:MAG TPA: acyl-CoA desaturase, partial [Moraxellaceae bacterium]
MTTATSERAPINWVAAIVLTATPIAAATIIPWYAFNFDFST